MLKQAQQMQSRMQEMQAKLEATEVEGAAGGGMIKVTLTGKGDLRRVAIDPSLMVADEREVLEDLLVAAHADAKQKVEAVMAEEMQKATGGLNLPGGLPGGLKLPF
jgi:DNA-binding YbaB/EbfC family protein